MVSTRPVTMLRTTARSAWQKNQTRRSIQLTTILPDLAAAWAREFHYQVDGAGSSGYRYLVLAAFPAQCQARPRAITGAPSRTCTHSRTRPVVGSTVATPCLESHRRLHGSPKNWAGSTASATIHQHREKMGNVVK